MVGFARSNGRRRSPWLLALTCGALGCAEAPPRTARLGYEVGDEACTNVLDDDRDGLTDCADPDCAQTSGVCGPRPPLDSSEPWPEGPVRLDPEGPVIVTWLLEVCTDRLDNDGDGRFDCGDPDCRRVPELCCGAERDDSHCSNALDDDGDGYVDCDDFDCASSAPCAPPRPAAAPPECTTAGACASATPEDSLATCADGADNDGDGYVDCDDFDCSRSAVEAIRARCARQREDAPETCTDGVDNDTDGFIDCDDLDCAGVLEATGAPCAAAEATPLACRNGRDDDGDGAVDCDDRSCRTTSDPRLAATCTESAPEYLGQRVLQPDERCSDGVDNDRDGFVDCADWDCSFDDRVTVCPGPPLGRCDDAVIDPPAACARPPGARVCP
jgi:hypothetical protein